MIQTVKRTVRIALREIGYDIVPASVALAQAAAEFPPDFDQRMIEICREIQPFTMTSSERIIALCTAVEYVHSHKVPGDIVECGVWKGGSMMAVARMLRHLGAERRLHLFDTFDGMPEPTDRDKDLHGKFASERMSQEDKDKSMVWAYCPLEEVRHNLEL